MAEAVADDDDPDLLVALLHNLAGLAYAEGRHGDAEALARQGIALRRPASVADRAADLAALAAIVAERDRGDEAELLYREALATREALGDGYEQAMTLNGLAGVVRQAGRHTESEALFRRALTGLEEHRGPAHPDTATVRNNLAMLLAATGRQRAARPLLDRAAADLTTMLGDHHPTTLDVATNRDRLH